MGSGAKYRKQGKKEGESEEIVRVREEDFFLVDSVPISSHPFFSAHFFFLARLLYLNTGPGYPGWRWKTRLWPQESEKSKLNEESRDHCFAIFKLILMK